MGERRPNTRSATLLLAIDSLLLYHSSAEMRGYKDLRTASIDFQGVTEVLKYKSDLCSSIRLLLFDLSCV